MKYALVVLATLAVLALLALAFPYTGLYDVSAAAGHTALTRWYLETTMEHSVGARAGAAAVPPALADSAAVARGAAAFAGMCQTCHGAPGVARGVIGEGLTPTPPALSEAAAEWSPAEVFWIVDNGVKMAGMPAFGETHTDEELWEVVAFVEALPETTPERYAELTAPPGNGGGGGASDGHDHAH